MLPVCVDAGLLHHQRESGELVERGLLLVYLLFPATLLPHLHPILYGLLAGVVEGVHLGRGMQPRPGVVEQLVDGLRAIAIGGEFGRQFLAGGEEGVEPLWRLSDVSPFGVPVAHDS